MTITEYAAALGGMLAQLAGMGILAAGLIKAKARHLGTPAEAVCRRVDTGGARKIVGYGASKSLKTRNVRVFHSGHEL
ncbi:hypothetical protein Q9R30_00090 [Arthrobacter sp. AB6]|uniref:hypothetical protein n=1 Tax=Arthrobacter sp. AB6 TaxID=2962570 RepID=UPI002880CA4C|nr:hypothetical protein [Arthrobacter sp. AB6]MDT0193752.1 hypothetical protein [Arthrobacter sp. AB6]